MEVPTDYRIVRGNAAQVELEIKQLLGSDEGWNLNGPLATVQFDTTTTIFAQGIVKYKNLPQGAV